MVNDPHKSTVAVRYTCPIIKDGFIQKVYWDSIIKVTEPEIASRNRKYISLSIIIPESEAANVNRLS